MLPMVSVVMPSLNQAGFIDAAIDSVLSQDYPHIELLVADGGSTDGTVEKLALRQTTDARLRWFSGQDKGPANAINKALARVRGTFVGWLNSDDLYMPGAIRRAVEAMAENPNWLMVYGHGQHVNAEGMRTDDYPTRPPSTSIQEFANGCFICQPTVFFRRTMFVLLGNLDENLKAAFDFDYWLRAFSAFPNRIGFVDAMQASSRLHEDCITLRMQHTAVVEATQVVARHLGQGSLTWIAWHFNELLSKPPEERGVTDIQAHLKSTIESVSPYISAEELDAWCLRLKSDLRFQQTTHEMG